MTVDPEDEVTIRHVAECIQKAVGHPGPLVWDTSKADGQLKKTADNSKLKGLMGGFAFTPLEQGVQESVDWFVKERYSKFWGLKDEEEDFGNISFESIFYQK